ncbi:type II toxin-antitoxin system prevent-host-death family antitoxin [Deinococcus pimensis]|uniref:type II toxin-antitoxin system prevent-host-death family antitoxin n=1 Tax=Deinococcus pimensis TaxID=309888 RepID=UPI0004AF8D6B|nr:type II toxin-antitoxin system prevent-host-death family antitoxin [Deinococcus pimensis]
MSQEGAASSVKSRDLRDALAGILRQVERGERVVIERFTSPVAALVPIEDYLTLRRLDAQRRHTAPPQENRMAHRIVVSNISGGEGKTSITRELALTLADQGYKVALIDSDPQASLTKTLGLHDPTEDTPAAALPGRLATHTIASVFDTDPDEAALPSPLHVHGVDIWVSNDALYQLDNKIAGDLTLIGNLREALNRVADRYDFILIDTKPGITPLLNAAMAAADHLLVPVSGDKGLENLDKLVKLVRSARMYAPGFQIRMLIPNRVRANTNTYKTLLANLHDYSQLAPLSSQIRDSVVMMDAQRDRRAVVHYRPNAEVAQDVRNVTRDLLVALGVVQTNDPAVVSP